MFLFLAALSELQTRESCEGGSDVSLGKGWLDNGLHSDAGGIGMIPRLIFCLHFVPWIGGKQYMFCFKPCGHYSEFIWLQDNMF